VIGGGSLELVIAAQFDILGTSDVLGQVPPGPRPQGTGPRCCPYGLPAWEPGPAGADNLGSLRIDREVRPLVVGGGMEGLNAFLPDWWLKEPLDTADDPPKPDSGHYPYARPLRGGWRKQSNGTWESTLEDEQECEVICEQCGDSGDRIEDQPEAAQALRGPYPSKHKATHVAKKHFDRFRPALNQ